LESVRAANRASCTSSAAQRHPSPVTMVSIA
jgi:hypothetical protein